MSAMGGVDNDTRGWIMSLVSGAACILGSSIICVDVLVRRIPGKEDFRIQDSNGFLACSLSLSFGVMCFSALYSMLPSSKRYLLKGGVAEQTAGFIMMGCFVAGFIGIQIISRVLHRFMPTHVVDCDHSHEAHGKDGIETNGGHQHLRKPRSRSSQASRRPRPEGVVGIEEVASEATPLLPSTLGDRGRPTAQPRSSSTLSEGVEQNHIAADALYSQLPSNKSRKRLELQLRRPSMIQVRNRVMSFVKDTKANCDNSGPCYGYTDPCGQECFKHLSSRNATVRATTSSIFSQHPPAYPSLPEDPEDQVASPISSTHQISRVRSRNLSRESHSEHGDHQNHEHHTHHTHHHHHDDDDASTLSQEQDDLEAQHHHHVPTNAFLSIGLQTVIAIALHKFPEGFITFATNHANPSLGFNVFMALAVHNIAEGFSLALPLYMALGSRWRALVWSSLLGGLSQPAGAAVAALWFRLARRGHVSIDSVAYACLFAVTAGIMTSVALQLFVESLSLNHNRNLSMGFAFLGMTLLGVSNALVTDE